MPLVAVRWTVRLAPFQVVAPSFSVSDTVALEPRSSVTVLPTPAQATLSVSRLPITGAELLPDTVMPTPVASEMSP